jgi:hypothetical protein
MSTLIIVDGMHTIIVVCRQRWIKSYWMTKTGKSVDEHRKGRPEAGTHYGSAHEASHQ